MANLPPGGPAQPAAGTALSRAAAVTRGALAAAAPASLALGLGGPPGHLPRGWPLYLAIATAAALALAARAVPTSPRGARFLMWIGIVAGGVLAAPALGRSPSLALLAFLCAIGATIALDRRTVLSATGRLEDVEASTARGAAIGSTLLWLIAVAMARMTTSMTVLAVGASSLVAGVAVFRWVARFGRGQPLRRAMLIAAAIATAAPLPFLAGQWGSFFGLIAIFPAVAIFVLPSGGPLSDETLRWGDLVFAHPARLLVVTFAVLCSVGTVALALPFSSATGQPLPYIDALFTAVSAVCVTGLIVRDTAVEFSRAGQVIIIVLVQLGALGIMTLSTAALGFLRRRMSLVHEGAVADLFAGSERGQLFRTVKRVLLVTSVVEGMGALLLWPSFVAAGDRPVQALGRAVFTAISAFCNAGFALQSDSLVGYAGNGIILQIVAVLIILGGISPLVALRSVRVLRGRTTRAQDKLVLFATALLLLGGAILFAMLEWNVSLAGLPVTDKLVSAWFHSASMRTAGFNSVDMAHLTPPTTTFMLLWMFIGGSPGSTAGGIKTTTAAVLLIAVVATIRGQPEAEAFDRRFSPRTVYRAAAIATTGAVAVFVAFMMMLLTQNMRADWALFEVVSALGTVGLSLGGTAKLDELGKVIIASCMFAGRLGPLTLLVFLSRRVKRTAWTRPQEEIDVG